VPLTRYYSATDISTIHYNYIRWQFYPFQRQCRLSPPLFSSKAITVYHKS